MYYNLRDNLKLFEIDFPSIQQISFLKYVVNKNFCFKLFVGFAYKFKNDKTVRSSVLSFMLINP